ncbi:MAG: methionyl-tRNA formyltransferase [Clostridia bacterium]
MRKDIKVVFMGTPEFARESLKGLYEAGFNVVGCYTNPDKPSGRGMKLKASAVKEYALGKNIPVFQPKKLRKNDEVLEQLKELNPDVIAVVAYGKILPKEILELPKYGCINVHGSLLPKYRGAAPMQWALINGEEKTGITTMFMDVGMDTGDMLLKEEVEIKDEYNLESIHDILMQIGSKLLVETIDKVVDGTIVRIPQPEEGTNAPMITREMTKIDFSKKPREIFNFVRGLSPFPGTYMELEDGRKFKVFDVDYIEDESIDSTVEPGDILLMSKDSLYIRCKNGYIMVKQIQPENSKRMDIKAFMAGNRFSMMDKFI